MSRIDAWFAKVKSWMPAKALALAVGKRLLLECGIPLMAAIFTAVRAYPRADHNLLNAILAGVPAFGLVLYLQGQLLRVVKNVEDRQRADDLSRSLASLTEAVEEIRAAIGRPAPAPSPSVPVFTVEDEPRQLFTAGHYVPALLLAAVELEHAIRDAARRLGVRGSRPGTEAASSLLSGLRAYIRDDQEWEELRSAWRARNSLVHASPADLHEAREPQTAGVLLDAFQRAKAALDILGD